MSPTSPKAHGAWLGAGSGGLIANVVIGLLQQYANHGKPLSAATIAAIYALLPPVLAFVAAWILPALPASLRQAAQQGIVQVTSTALPVPPQLVPQPPASSGGPAVAAQPVAFPQPSGVTVLPPSTGPNTPSQAGGL